jgi:glycerol dehydrogenase-like iron-containing ADH family enzyme
MRLKSELYQKEQYEIVDKIIEILDLNNGSFTLYDMDRDKDKQEKIMALAIEIRKYFTYTGIAGVKEKMKRPWLSIIKNVCKLKYNIKLIFLHK